MSATGYLILALSVSTLAGCRSATAQARPQSDLPLHDEDVKLASFEDLAYPLLARRAKVQGVVVVKATLDENGRVVGASAISGANLLIPDVLENAKKWTFRPNSRHSAVIVYDFRIDEGACHDALKSLFLLKHPNLASITACTGVVEG